MRSSTTKEKRVVDFLPGPRAEAQRSQTAYFPAHTAGRTLLAARSVKYPKLRTGHPILGRPIFVLSYVIYLISVYFTFSFLFHFTFFPSKFNFNFLFFSKFEIFKKPQNLKVFVHVFDKCSKFKKSFCFEECSNLYFFFLNFVQNKTNVPNFIKNLFIFHNYVWFPIILFAFENVVVLVKCLRN